MAVVVNKIHHKNPSGFHNKVKWVLSQSGYDIKKITELQTKTLVHNKSWLDAFCVSFMIVLEDYDSARAVYPDGWSWIKKYISKLKDVNYD